MCPNGAGRDAQFVSDVLTNTKSISFEDVLNCFHNVVIYKKWPEIVQAMLRLIDLRKQNYKELQCL